ncbi:MAG TPA: ABC transporter permease [Gemmatimonadota bacterium]|nr:ABC transporter permease [Gemmatimonadota bacterium]
MKAVRDTLRLFMRELRISLRMPIWIIISIVQPIIWLVLFSQLFRVVGSLRSFPGGSYLGFLAPGLAIMSSLFSSAYGGMGLLRDIERGFVDRLLATPANRGALIGARVLHAAATVMFQAAVILVIAFLLGVRPGSWLLGILTVLAAAGLLGGAFGAASNGLALLAGRYEILMAVMNFTVLPLTFLSTMIMARPLMPGWMQTVTRFNPVDWAVSAARDGFVGTPGSGLAAHFLLLAAFAAVCWFLAARTFDRYLARS